jgi:hypothetical protein
MCLSAKRVAREHSDWTAKEKVRKKKKEGKCISRG